MTASTPGLVFQTATKVKAKMKVGIYGPPGSGKTYTALTWGCHVAAALSGRLAVIDTEHGRASKYASGKPFDFDVIELNEHQPLKFVEAIRAAEQAGYPVLVIDSFSHEWIGKGGILETHQKTTDSSMSKNGYIAWGKVKPLHQQVMEAILGANVHIIATMRAKLGYEEAVTNGRKSYVSVGMQPQQQDDAPYEFDVLFSMDHENVATVVKPGTSALNGKVIKQPTTTVIDTILEWLNDGAEPQPKEAPKVVTNSGRPSLGQVTTRVQQGS